MSTNQGELSSELMLEQFQRGQRDFRGIKLADRSGLSGAILREIDLTDSNLSFQDLRAADMQQACLEAAQLKSANLRAANLTYSNLKRADLREAKLQGATLRSADLSSANLDGADLSQTDMTHARLANAKITNVIFRGAILCDTFLAHTDLRKSTFRGANLTSVDFSTSRISTTDFSDANLENSDLSNCEIVELNFCGANLTNSNLSGLSINNRLNYFDRLIQQRLNQNYVEQPVSFEKAILHNANLKGCKLQNTILIGADFTGADLSDADLSGADITDAIFSNAQVRGLQHEDKDSILEMSKSSVDCSSENSSGGQIAAEEASGENIELEDSSPITEKEGKSQVKNKWNVYLWNNLEFRSRSEIKIAQALDRKHVLYLPCSRVRLTTNQGRRNYEIDFLICYEGKWGILEVDGPHHHGSTTAIISDQERDRYFRQNKIYVVERFDARRCYNTPDQVVEDFLLLLSTLG